MKILITGATGFIGSHLTKKLLKDNHEVHALVRPSTNTGPLTALGVAISVFDQDNSVLQTYFEHEKFDGIIHLASLYLSQHKPEEVKNLIDSNILLATQILDAAKNNVTWFINTGTFWQHYDQADYSPVNLYAATKRAFEDISNYYIAVSPINFVTIKLSDTFGPDDTRQKIFNLWSKISKSRETLDMSPGEQIIDINFIGNIVDGYSKMIELLAADPEKKLKGRSFAIQSPERMSLRKLAEVFERVTQTKLNINWGKKEYRPREIMEPWNKGTPIPDWKPLISLEEGIKITYNL
ncbi:MAG: NAD(P)-dependent oxidoreductase [bacterium]|nr:NAD(P)-dependent oxidoreductase [bacterium]